MAKRKQKILHVDDEEDILVVVNTILKKAGFQVTSVESGDEALERFHAEIFDLVILDIMIPDLSGLEIYTLIIKEKPGQRVILLTVLDTPQKRRQHLWEEGVLDCITKPFDREDLVKRVKKALAVKL